MVLIDEYGAERRDNVQAAIAAERRRFDDADVRSFLPVWSSARSETVSNKPDPAAFRHLRALKTVKSSRPAGCSSKLSSVRRGAGERSSSSLAGEQLRRVEDGRGPDAPAADAVAARVDSRSAARRRLVLGEQVELTVTSARRRFSGGEGGKVKGSAETDFRPEGEDLQAGRHDEGAFNCLNQWARWPPATTSTR
ncbi:three-helix bundle dimerization domain-containing protein [Amycolatopsis sp. NPDC003731]